MTRFAALALMSLYVWPWVGWGVTFFIIELSALALRRSVPDVSNNGGTLSELVWWLIRGRQWPHRLALVGFAVFWVALTLHFFIGTPLI